MAKITAAEVGKLRKTTGAGMMDCKKALVEAEGDFEKAIEILRKKGQKVAAKRADRDSSEGVVVAKVNESNTRGVMISLNCETDFVAKNDDYVALANKIADVALNTNTKEELLAASFDGMTVAEKLIEQTGVIGEKLEIGGFEAFEAPFVGAYVHGGKIGALTGLSTASDNSSEVAKSVSMQVASMGATTLSYKDFDADFVQSETEARIAAIEKDNIERGRLGKALKNIPLFISRSQVTDTALAEAKVRFEEELKAEGKPEAIWDRIIPGKLERFISDNVSLDKELALLDQDFIMDDSKTVAQYVESKGASVVGFKRVSIA
ncbi:MULTISPECIES: translation elongation factor Ts [Nonlabens]|uniref:Elongation factor Ts n=1 Tax=Nonlabens ulvanivorans TaxID=906888 RepID=A0A084JV05_NONUL|nr:translation elongation factor Ts [Nonlabens ulvanivorans]KEZ92789.1 elongation factor Ts [Nonlabens ulvanivorans]PRX15639.1 translation elongation factor Ts (EF-Ts) [Nonlabens ulvanivorans]WOI22022.1 translation elongation factor Ts [Nonlabens ulvanivorans]GAK76770.1 translation elongation factor Ts [Nonlabens ulvanivorans]GAL00147.1 translation elongation factor Ts [Nonlabens ulvanivorans]